MTYDDPEDLAKMKAAEKVPKYEPFTNRTPLICDNAESLSNGVGTICNPCGIRCKGFLLLEKAAKQVLCKAV